VKLSTALASVGRKVPAMTFEKFVQFMMRAENKEVWLPFTKRNINILREVRVRTATAPNITSDYVYRGLAGSPDGVHGILTYYRRTNAGQNEHGLSNSGNV